MKSFEDILKISRKKALSLLYHIDKEAIGCESDEQSIENVARRLNEIDFLHNELEKYDAFNIDNALRIVSSKIKQQQRRRKIIKITSIASSVAAIVILYFFSFNNESEPEQIAQSIEISIPNNRIKAVLYDESGNSNTIDSETKEVNINGEVVKNDPSTSSISYAKLNNRNVSINRLKVPRKGIYRLILHDSTIVTLNSDSYLEYPSAFEGDNRTVKLIGEALFEVKHNSKAKFVVTTQRGDITVYGTMFNVKSYDNESVTNVTLVNGSIAFNNDSYSIKLDPGEKATVNDSTSEITKQKVNVVSDLAWLTNMFDYTDIPLETVVKDIERCYDVEIEFANPVLRGTLVTFYLSKNNDIESVMETIMKCGSITVIKNGTIYTLK